MLISGCFHKSSPMSSYSKNLMPSWISTSAKSAGKSPDTVYHSIKAGHWSNLVPFSRISCNHRDFLSAQDWTEVLEILLQASADPNASHLVDTFLYEESDVQCTATSVLLWQSPLAVVQNRYREAAKGD